MAQKILKISGLMICFCLCASISFAQTQQQGRIEEEKITIATYFPSPFGVYSEFQLFPHNTPVTPCNATGQGTFYMNTQNQLFVCDGAGNWLPVGGGGNWTLTGNNLYPTDSAWNVGIGLAAPITKLDVNGQFGARNGLCIAGECKPDWSATPVCPEGQCLDYIDLANPADAHCTTCTGEGPTPTPLPVLSKPSPPPTLTWKLYGVVSCGIANPTTNAPGMWIFKYNYTTFYYCSSSISKPATAMPACTPNSACTSSGTYCCYDCYIRNLGQPGDELVSTPCSQSITMAEVQQMCNGQVYQCSP